MINSADEIFTSATAQLKTDVVSCELGDIGVREMMTDELIQYRHKQSCAFDAAGVSMADIESASNTEMAKLQMQSHGVSAWLISCCAIDAGGQRIFSSADVERIKSLPAAVSDALNKAILQLSGLAQERGESAVESEKKD